MSAPDSHEQSRHKTKWSLTPEAFEKLLNAFSANRDEAGVQYEIMRPKLVRFFEWRKVESAQDYADETINRVARRIESGEVTIGGGSALQDLTSGVHRGAVAVVPTAGVTWVGSGLAARTRAELLDRIAAFGHDIIMTVRR